MLVTPVGIMMLVRLEQLENAWDPMEVTGLLFMVDGMTTAPVGKVT